MIRKYLLVILLISYLPDTASGCESYNYDYERTFTFSHVYFTANRGQFDPCIKFLCKMNGSSIFFSENELTFVFSGNSSQHSENILNLSGKDYTCAVKLRFENTKKRLLIKGIGRLPWKSGYFKGKDPSGWRTGIPNYTGVLYKDIYEGIDFVAYGTVSGPAFTFIIRPGANPGDIRLMYDFGEKGIVSSVDINGRLNIDSPLVRLLWTGRNPFYVQMRKQKKLSYRLKLAKNNRGDFSLT